MMSESDLDEFNKFVKEKSKQFERTSQSVHQSLEEVRVNIQWHAKNYHKVIEVLEKSL